MSAKKPEETKTQSRHETFNITDVISNNSSISDFRQAYLKKQGKVLIDSSTEIHREIVRKYNLCNNLLKMYLKREILTKLPRVRYKACNDLWEVKVQSNEMKLTDKMKTFLQILSERGVEFLQNQNILQDFVEIDKTADTAVEYKGKIVNLQLDMDVMCPLEKMSAGAEVCKKENKLPLVKVDLISINEVSCNAMRPRKGILKRSKKIEESQSIEFVQQNVIELNESESDEELTNQNTQENQSEPCDTMILNFVLCLRRSLPADLVFKQFLSKHIIKRQMNMILVFHVGPLVKDQEIVLYKYQSNGRYETLIYEMSKTESGHMDLDQMITAWFENEGKLVHQFTDSRESIKDSIYEYQGLEKIQHPVKKNKTSSKEKKKLQTKS